MKSHFVFFAFFAIISSSAFSQTKQDSLDIKQVALDYIEAQHNLNPEQFERAAHPRMVKRTFWKDKTSKKEYLGETFTDYMVMLSEVYNRNGDRFPKKPKKEVILLDVSDRTASVKLIADEWIDYMHIIKINDAWKIVNVLWQYNDTTKH
ncbi:nuclear transport factor 2 family protein [Aquimarina gracilis]|uniref:Nuclear transport factor 2 family protein n=1 Tax=Aquimarina gracilis TaxID=874422 RepID=A0ABU5ZWF6_9FLAO|nr:nuclear transport factor 2 family protein [Aquimarina gracilis]MEB3346186.1 nuclear transport factor 2 family protein [Aquimarina gracilis]